MPSPLVLWSCQKKITYAVYYKNGSLRRQKTENQAFISLHLQVDQIRKSLNTRSFSVHAASVKLFSSNVTHAYRPWQIYFSVMYVHVLPFYNICSLTYFHIKYLYVFVKQKMYHSFFHKHSVFYWVSVSMLMVFLNLTLHYTCNILEIVGTT